MRLANRRLSDDHIAPNWWSWSDGYSVDGGCRNGVHRNGGERHGGERRGGERHGGYADGRGNGGGSGNRSGNGAADGSFQNCGFVNLRGPPPKGPAVKRAQRS